MKVLLAVVLSAAAAIAQSPVPRPAGALYVDGKDVLTRAAGRPVVLAMVSTQCGHCAAVARVMQQAASDFSAVFFVAVTMDEGADPAAWSQKLGLSFPVYKGDRELAMKFLGLTDTRLGTPQMVYIDRMGVIRAQSERVGTPMLQASDYMRSLVGALLKGSHGR